MKNPFEFGRELDPIELVNRHEEMQIVRETIETGGKLFVIGPRRFGKTSLLSSVAEKTTAGRRYHLKLQRRMFS